MMTRATAIAHPNIALIKYWGKRDLALNLPAVSSVSLTLSGFRTKTTVETGASVDTVRLDGQVAPERFTGRVLAFLDRILVGRGPLVIDTESNFPMGAGLASSASGFAALTLAACAATDRPTDPVILSTLSRLGSGSACRSFWEGFVHWRRGAQADGTDSHGYPIDALDGWDLAMVIGVVETGPKAVGSTEGMERSRSTSAFYQQWVDSSERDVSDALLAIERRDLDGLGVAMERSTFKMHATMHSATPPLIYWKAQTLDVLQAVFDLRERGISAWATMDAGPQVKILCPAAAADEVVAAIQMYTKETHILHPGPGAHLLGEP